MPDNIRNPSDPFADYGAARLRAFLTEKRDQSETPEFRYSNLGFGLLGYALDRREDLSYEDLIKANVTGPIEMRDTAVALSPLEAERLLPSYGASFERPRPGSCAHEFFEAACGLSSSGGDLLR
jgi:CubicO group peptidase (beta-lactamase class C family)